MKVDPYYTAFLNSFYCIVLYTNKNNVGTFCLLKSHYKYTEAAVREALSCCAFAHTQEVVYIIDNGMSRML